MAHHAPNHLVVSRRLVCFQHQHPPTHITNQQPQSLLNFKGTLNAADGIIISRGNLGLDCLPEKMALIQKTLIQTCNLVGKPVLITRVVDTMAVSPRPTRAEATGERQRLWF